mmetsp:Transcript_5150/g.20551  ORF Transcript_5150/g.20551 Transcript_5150/m.20551 type:complete len:457 (+) Transcript_5150:1681-3051(+)|eukprot:scaffold1596_cov302-Pinguiococcus_pyrenoidosus.AAC.86
MYASDAISSGTLRLEEIHQCRGCGTLRVLLRSTDAEGAHRAERQSREGVARGRVPHVPLKGKRSVPPRACPQAADHRLALRRRGKVSAVRLQLAIELDVRLPEQRLVLQRRHLLELEHRKRREVDADDVQNREPEAHATQLVVLVRVDGVPLDILPRRRVRPFHPRGDRGREEGRADRHADQRAGVVAQHAERNAHSRWDGDGNAHQQAERLTPGGHLAGRPAVLGLLQEGADEARHRAHHDAQQQADALVPQPQSHEVIVGDDRPEGRPQHGPHDRRHEHRGDDDDGVVGGEPHAGKDGGDDHQADVVEGQGRGIADLLLHLLHPHFRRSRDVERLLVLGLGEVLQAGNQRNLRPLRKDDRVGAIHGTKAHALHARQELLQVALTRHQRHLDSCAVDAAHGERDRREQPVRVGLLDNQLQNALHVHALRAIRVDLGGHSHFILRLPQRLSLRFRP